MVKEIKSFEEFKLNKQLLNAVADVVTRSFPGTCLREETVLRANNWPIGHHEAY